MVQWCNGVYIYRRCAKDFDSIDQHRLWSTSLFSPCSNSLTYNVHVKSAVIAEIISRLCKFMFYVIKAFGVMDLTQTPCDVHCLIHSNHCNTNISQKSQAESGRW